MLFPAPKNALRVLVPPAALVLLNGYSPAHGLSIGDPVCIEGYIMDLFCINRGTLLDNPSVQTLRNPEKHSIHCLVDIGVCVNSGYEVLIDPPESGVVPDPPFRRGYRLDESGNALVRDLAQRSGMQGFCSTCNGELDDQEVGFRAVINGTITSLGDASTPATLEVLAAENPMFGATCGDNATVPVDFVSATAGSDAPYVLSHASLMLIGWGLLLPAGVINGRLLKHRPNALWFRVHRGMQIMGLLFVIPAFIIALMKFDVFSNPNSTAFRHGVLGSTTMALGLAQPINAVLRPHPPGNGEAKSSVRQLWEVGHKLFGYIACVLAVATIGLGTTLLPPDLKKTYIGAYAGGCGGLLFSLIVFLLYDNRRYAKELKDTEEAEAPVTHGNA